MVSALSTEIKIYIKLLCPLVLNFLLKVLTLKWVCGIILSSGICPFDTHCTREPSEAGKTDCDARLGTAHGARIFARIK